MVNISGLYEECDVQVKRKQFRSPGAKNEEQRPPKTNVLVRFLIFGQIFGPVFDQIFGKGFDQGFGEGKNHKYSSQYYPAEWKTIKNQKSSKQQLKL